MLFNYFSGFVQRYLNKIWSIFFSFLSVSTFSNFPFREYLVNLFQFNHLNQNFFINTPPELFYFPIRLDIKYPVETSTHATEIEPLKIDIAPK